MLEVHRKAQRRLLRTENSVSYSYLRTLETGESQVFGSLAQVVETWIRTGDLERRSDRWLQHLFLPLHGSVILHPADGNARRLQPGEAAAVLQAPETVLRLESDEEPCRLLEIGFELNDEATPEEAFPLPELLFQVRDFRKPERWPAWSCILSDRGEGESLQALSDATVSRLFVSGGEHVRYETLSTHRLLLIVLRGALQAGSLRLLEGDSLRCLGEAELEIAVHRSADLVLIELG